MKVDENKKYAIVPIHYMAIPLDKLDNLISGAVSVERSYESNHGYRFALTKSQQFELQIVDGEQIMVDTAIARMSEDKS